MNNIPDGLMDKLLKLKNLKEGAEAVGSHAEAANAAARMQELLLKHNLDESVIDQHGIKQKATMINERIDVNKYQSKTEAGWFERLCQVVSYFCMCKIVSHTMYRKKNDQGDITILGEKTNVATCLYIIEQLISKIDIASRHAWKKYQERGGWEKRNTFMRGFLKGAVEAIGDKMKEQEDLIKQQQAAQNTNLGLVLVNKRELATKYMTEVFPNLGKKVFKQGSNLSGAHGKAHGYEAGRRMDINKGVGGSTGNKQLN